MTQISRMLVLLATFFFLCAPARAADWPTKAVTIIVPFGAGGNTDMMARLAAQHLTEKFGQPFVVENRPGAGGALATGAVATSAPDGYTLLFSAAANIVLTPQVQKLNFDPLKQLAPITNMGTGTQMVAVNNDLPVKTLPEFIAYAKANPGKLNFSVAGTNNISHLAPMLLFARAGIQLVMVPAKSEPLAIADIIAGQTNFYFGNSSSLLPQVRAGKLRVIAVGTAERVPAAPEVPPVADTLPGFQFASWNGFSAPTATPDAITAAIGKEVAAFAKSPAISKRLSDLGIVPGGLTKAQSEEVFRKDYESFAAAIKAAGIPPVK